MKKKLLYFLGFLLISTLLFCTLKQTSDPNIMQQTADSTTIKGQVQFYVTNSSNGSPVPDAEIVIISGDKIVGKLKTKNDGRTSPVDIESQFDDRFALVQKNGLTENMKHGVIQAVILKEGYYPGVILDVAVVEKKGGISGSAISLDPIPADVPVHPYTDHKTVVSSPPSKYDTGNMIKIIKDQLDAIENIQP